MQLEDMAEYDPGHPIVLESPQWKKWVLFVFGVVIGLGWAVVSVLIAIELAANKPRISGQGQSYLIYAASSSFCWVCPLRNYTPIAKLNSLCR